MTSETAKIKVEMLDNYLSHTCQDYGERDHEAMMMAIKALEQEPFMNKPCVAHQVCHEDKVKILDKIRADVINIADGKRSMPVRSIVKILDKYKAESEEKNED